MFDVKQTEIFRGPQGTRFGANALAGIINIQTNNPTDTFEGKVKGTLGNYGSQGLGVMFSGPMKESVNYRLAAEKYKGDGFMDNVHLDRKDTSDRDELSLRGKLAIELSNDLTLDLTAMHFDFDNGYDAFSLDNTRVTYSDEPGFDKQDTSALAATLNYSGLASADIKFVSSVADSEMAYGYDEDWAFGQYEWLSDDDVYTPDPCVTPTGCLADFDGYSSTDHYFREKKTQTFELRATSKDGQEIFNGSTAWVTGIYVKNDESKISRIYTWDADFHSTFKTDTFAAYTELETKINTDLTLTTGLRVEDRSANYQNSKPFSAKPSETMFGGKATLSYVLSDTSMLFASINRGYKAGGVNTDGTLTNEQREFDSEYLWNYELSYKATYLDNRAFLRAALFYMDRKDVQVKISYQLPNSSEFIQFIDNASAGTNQGIELEAGWQVTNNVDIYAALGLLDSEYEAFSFPTEDGLIDLSGRDQAHASNYQFNVGVNYYLSDAWLFNLSVEGKDEFYFSDNHNEKSDSVTLVNASLQYSQDNWDVTLWGRNITDQDYQTRGFYFANDPRDYYTPKAYYQFGEPAVFGLTANYHF